ncbi:hypothetical protein BDF20DRAFT_68945 [Mycotypha africana]|uniref:uncharacterized protein n=1 Tax=Mycotypha africana TaxID=64632 RepID=UPI0023014432|nr:uncharacterized protein BDF20DRAFT_68945 [Mycotypha africana]KAI8991877.1 hypothetical protein BDF20DRAFT_68945 [Mycotypha africana]
MESPATASPQEELNDFYILNGPTVPENSSKSISNNNSRPYRLEQRFEQKLSLSESNHRDGSIKRAQAAEQKRKAFLEQKKGNLSKNYTLKVKKIAKEAKANRERKLYTLSKSMELAEFNRKQYIEQKRAKSKESVERAKYVALQHQLRSEQEQST